jgi:phospholipase A1/A2
MPPVLLAALSLFAAVEQTPVVEPLVRAPGAPPRTAIDEPVATTAQAQYFFLHDDNFFAAQANGGWPARVKFQVSLRFEALSLGGEEHNFALNFAYTQKSFWDLFDTNASEPIVENNYRPEGFLSYRPRRPERFREVQVGIQHESNGLGVVGSVDNKMLSRGWNYVFADARWGLPGVPQANPWVFLTPGLRLWIPFDASDGLVDGLGYFQAYADLDVRVPFLPTAARVSMRFKVQRHSFQSDLTYPVAALLTGGRVRMWFFFQYFHGRGERLLTAGASEDHLYGGFGFQ